MSDEFAQWMAEATPDEATIGVCLQRGLYRQLNEAVADLEAVKVPKRDATTLDDAPPADELEVLAQRVVDLEQAIRDAERPLVFKCLILHEWKNLAGKHPPTREQREQNLRADVNDDTFWPAAVAACCTSPGLSLEQAKWLQGFLPRGKWWEITSTVQRANVGGSGIPKSVSSTVARLKQELSSTTARPEESPSASSEDESPNQETLTG